MKVPIEVQSVVSNGTLRPWQEWKTGEGEGQAAKVIWLPAPTGPAPR